jgi:CheY-like chemotaxis protein
LFRRYNRGAAPTLRRTFLALNARSEPVTISTILLIDDDRVVGSSLKRLAELAFPGFHVLWAKNGFTGLDAVQRHADALRLVVLDVHMPLLDGRLVAAQIRAIAPQVPIMPFSSHEHMLVALVEMGCAEPVLKHPAVMGQMAERMRRAMAAPVPPPPDSPWMSAMRQSSDLVVSFVREQMQGAPVNAEPDARLSKICTRLEQYCARFPSPAREVTQALKELRDVLK